MVTSNTSAKFDKDAHNGFVSIVFARSLSPPVIAPCMGIFACKLVGKTKIAEIKQKHSQTTGLELKAFGSFVKDSSSQP